MQVTLGELGSGFSMPAAPHFLPPDGNMGENWPPFRLPLLLSRRLREEESKIWDLEGGGASLARARLSKVLEDEEDDESFMEEEEWNREVEQMKSSPVAVAVVELLQLILVVRWGLW